MERVQSVKITLSNGRAGVFYGAPLTDGDGEQAEVVAVDFDAPRWVAGVRMNAPPVPTDAPVG